MLNIKKQHICDSFQLLLVEIKEMTLRKIKFNTFFETFNNLARIRLLGLGAKILFDIVCLDEIKDKERETNSELDALCTQINYLLYKWISIRFRCGKCKTY